MSAKGPGFDSQQVQYFLFVFCLCNDLGARRHDVESNSPTVYTSNLQSCGVDTLLLLVYAYTILHMCEGMAGFYESVYTILYNHY